MNNDLKIFNVTNRTDPLLDKLYCQHAGVGNEDFPKNYLKCKSGDNIFDKDPTILNLFFIIGFGKINLKIIVKTVG